MTYTEKQIADAFEKTANRMKINLNDIPLNYLERMIAGALICNFATPEIFNGFIEEALRIAPKPLLN